ncbi:MAG: hypothetical protein WAS21_17880 [Geminicoccaceae bacterium]
MTITNLKERAIRDPQRVFASPEAVIHADDLPIEHKRTILERWRQLVGSLPGRSEPTTGEPSMTTRLTRALAFLDTETGGHRVTHNQGFYTSIGDIGKSERDKEH